MINNIAGLLVAILCVFYHAEGAPSKTCEVKDSRTIIGDLFLELSPQNCNAVLPKDCKDIYDSGIRASGLYTVYISDRFIPIRVYCDMSLPGGGWTVMLKRRETGANRENFTRPWEDYVRGFGDFNKEYIMGLEHMHIMTTGKFHTELYIGMQNHDTVAALFGTTICDVYKHAHYSQFKVGSSKGNYKLHVTGFDKDSTAGDSLTQHHGKQFSTYDKDNDGHETANCAHRYRGGWWYHDCHLSQLTGKWYSNGDHLEDDGIIWESLHGRDYSLKSVIMAFRRVQ